MLADEAVECWIKKSGVDLFCELIDYFLPFYPIIGSKFSEMENYDVFTS